MYRILLRGGLDERWSHTLAGMKISVSLDECQCLVTTLSGELQDQAALFGVLSLVYDLGLPVVLVQRLNEGNA